MFIATVSALAAIAHRVITGKPVEAPKSDLQREFESLGY